MLLNQNFTFTALNGRSNPFVRISIGDDLFQSGDSKLRSVSVTLAEGNGQNSCTFKVRSDTKLVDKYFTYIHKNDGLDPIVTPQQSGQSVNTSTGSFNGNIPSLNGVDPSKIKEAVNFYLSKGLSVEGTAYLVGNYIQESSLNELADNGQGNIGLGQWDSYRRSTNGGMPNGFREQMAWALLDMVSDGTVMGHNIRSAVNGSDVSAIRQGLADWMRYGSGESGGRYEYGARLLEALRNQVQPGKASDSVERSKKPETTPKKTAIKSYTGSQITVELGFFGRTIAAFSFLHTSIDYDIASKTLTFGGQASTWVLTQRIQSTAYQNLTFKQIAQKICEKYGLKLEMEGEGSKYEYFTQLGQTDYESLLIEARRIGYRVKSDGATLYLSPRKKDSMSDFTLTYGENLTTFNVKHSAQSDGSGGARSSSPNASSTTGERKFSIDPDTGELKQEVKEDKTGTGEESSQLSVTGHHVAAIKPVTDGSTDVDNKRRRENELRVKGIIAEFSTPTVPELLILDPDMVFTTSGISEFLDRAWVIDTITHDYSESSGFTTSGTVYTPLKNKNPQPESESVNSQNQAVRGASTSLRNPTGFIHPTAGVGYLSSPFGMRGGRLHGGVDVAHDPGTPIYASKAGTVVDVQIGCQPGDYNCGSGYGNLVILQHEDGSETLYGHNQSVLVSMNQKVNQGDQIATMGYTGSVRPAGVGGTHLHFEIKVGGSKVNPENYIEFR